MPTGTLPVAGVHVPATTIWVPNWENRDLRQLLWHRHRMVQARTRIMNQLQAVALNEGLLCRKNCVDSDFLFRGVVEDALRTAQT